MMHSTRWQLYVFLAAIGLGLIACTASAPPKPTTRFEDDFSGPGLDHTRWTVLEGEAGVRGKYAARYQAGTNLVLLEPDVAKAFPTEKEVNEALRLVMQLTKVQRSGKRTPAKV